MDPAMKKRRKSIKIIDFFIVFLPLNLLVIISKMKGRNTEYRIGLGVFIRGLSIYPRKLRDRLQKNTPS
jgi:hypothetical protein